MEGGDIGSRCSFSVSFRSTCHSSLVADIPHQPIFHPFFVTCLPVNRQHGVAGFVPFIAHLHLHALSSPSRTVFTFTHCLHLHALSSPSRTVFTFTHCLHLHALSSPSRTSSSSEIGSSRTTLTLSPRQESGRLSRALHLFPGRTVRSMTSCPSISYLSGIFPHQSLQYTRAPAMTISLR